MRGDVNSAIDQVPPENLSKVPSQPPQADPETLPAAPQNAVTAPGNDARPDSVAPPKPPEKTANSAINPVTETSEMPVVSLDSDADGAGGEVQVADIAAVEAAPEETRVEARLVEPPPARPQGEPPPTLKSEPSEPEAGDADKAKALKVEARLVEPAARPQGEPPPALKSEPGEPEAGDADKAKALKVEARLAEPPPARPQGEPPPALKSEPGEPKVREADKAKDLNVETMRIQGPVAARPVPAQPPLLKLLAMTSPMTMQQPPSVQVPNPVQPQPSAQTTQPPPAPIQAVPAPAVPPQDAQAAPAKPDSGSAPTATEQAATLKCPNCGAPYRVGELTCANCNFVFSASARTHKIDDPQEASAAKSWPTGDVVAVEQKPITFEIEGKAHTFLVRDTVIIGRVSGIAGDISPDVDLNPFGAGDKGVSRRHLRMKRKGSMIYIADLNSMNGTYLNGRRLIPEGERLLRSGDELRLGHMRIRVKF